MKDLIITAMLTVPTATSQLCSQHCAELPMLQTAQRAVISLSTEESVSFPSGSTGCWPIASNLRQYCFKIILFTYSFWGCAVSSLLCKLFSICGERGPLYSCVSGLLTVVVPLGEHAHWGMRASVVARCGLNTRSCQALEHRLSNREYGLSCSVACGTFLDRG